MSDEQVAAAKGGGVLHIPTALGAIVATYNLPGMDLKLKFTGDTLAGIFLGAIQSWNDPRLVYREIPERPKALAITRMACWATHAG